MTDEKEKLKRFNDAVNAETQNKVKEIIDEAKKQSEGLLQKANKDAESYVKNELESIKKLQDEKKLREISAFRLESQKKVLKHREMIADKVFENVKKKLGAFRAGKEYAEWLINTAKLCKEKYPEEKGVVFVSVEDIKYSDKITASTGYEVRTSHDIISGGLNVCFEDKNIILDSSFDSLLENERQNFCQNAELSVSNN